MVDSFCSMPSRQCAAGHTVLIAFEYHPKSWPAGNLLLPTMSSILQPYSDPAKWIGVPLHPACVCKTKQSNDVRRLQQHNAKQRQTRSKDASGALLTHVPCSIMHACRHILTNIHAYIHVLLDVPAEICRLLTSIHRHPFTAEKLCSATNDHKQGTYMLTHVQFKQAGEASMESTLLQNTPQQKEHMP